MTKKLWSEIKIECKRCNQLFSYTTQEFLNVLSVMDLLNVIPVKIQ